jgi:diguanylate cyclase (GGDEF)-like protein
MQEQLRILHVGKEPAVAEAVRDALGGARLGPTIRRVADPEGMLAALNEERWEVVIAADVLDGLPLGDVLRLAHLRDPELPVIVIASTPGEEQAVSAIKLGAQDYILARDLGRLGDAVVREMKDATARRARRLTEARLEQLAMQDALTELPNRRLFEDRLANALRVATRDRHGLILMVMDLNGFKPVNDTFGHHAGDLLLRLVGVRLREALRESDTVARLGGDEFGVLVPKHEGDMVPPQLLARLMGAFELPFRIEGVDVRIGASLGIAIFPDHGTDAETLFRNADSAMYTAKRARSGHAIYDARSDAYSRDRSSMLEDLRTAIEKEQLVLHYQPVVELRTGRCRDVEALVRWQHPERGLISPGEFLPMFERLRLMRNLSEWVIERALRQSAAWREAGIELDVTVNLAAQNLADAELVSSIEASVARSGAPANWLRVEIPESVIMSDPDRSGRAINELGAIGVRFAIDDFGTGFSSLAYLDRLKFDRLKVDRSFVSGAGHAGRRVAIVRAATELGHTLGFAVLAEGIEDAEGCARVRAQGCELGQGYHFAAALPPDRIPSWLRERPRGQCRHYAMAPWARLRTLVTGPRAG